MPDQQLDIMRILEILPQRYPFLLIDRVLELEPPKRLVALKNVTINEPFFSGHFPGVPVMPGVLILEAMGQAGGIMVSTVLDHTDQDSILYFTGMDKVRFRKPVVPGDQLVIAMEVLKTRAKAFKMAATATVDGKVAAQAELMATLGDRP
jgi:beta-hydroxyacyl-ACP dehydratase FabZ